MVRRAQKRRKGAALVEIAVILPLMILLVSVAADITMGIFRFHQVSTLARVGVRYATVHAGQYAEGETDYPQSDPPRHAVTQDELRDNVIIPQSVYLDSNLLTVTLSWLPSGSSYPYTVSTDTGRKTSNMVRVVVSYQWTPMFLFGNTVTLTSTSESTIQY